MQDDAIRDLLGAVGPISIKRMFGGKGIYAEGVIFALEVDGEILLKADSTSAAEFEAAGARRWAYEGKGKPVLMPYWTIPDEAVDDADSMAIWARKALEAGLRSRK